VVGTGGLQHLALRFGKKKPDFDPEVLMTKLKNAIETERRSMKLPEFASWVVILDRSIQNSSERVSVMS
jgi:hypothetical protein